MPSLTIRDATPDDAAAILDLNAASVNVLSPLDMPRLEALSSRTYYFRVADREGKVVGFMMAFPDGTNYDNPNYRWFAERYSQFVYIDRIVVSVDVRGAGLGSAFYRDLEERVRAANIPWLTAEVDVIPPNTPSLLFHDKLGFVEVGQHTVGSSNKVVSLRAKSLEPQGGATAQ